MSRSSKTVWVAVATCLTGALVLLTTWWFVPSDRSRNESRHLDPCGGPDHPCTLFEVSAAAETRTMELAELAMARISSANDKDAAAGWLATQPDVVSVATGAEAVRFRVRGGRGHWIFVQTLGNVMTLSAPAVRKPANQPGVLPVLSRAARSTAPSGEVEMGLQNATGSNRQSKRALLISPFRWQWEITGTSDGLDEVAQRLQARDYRDGVDLRTERLDPGNPHCQPGAVRWQECHTLGEITLDSYSIWQGYDYIQLVTHGGAVRQDGRSLTAVMTSWTLELIRGVREAFDQAPSSEGRDKALNIIGAMGIETASVHGVALAVLPEEVPRLGHGQRLWPVNAPITTIVKAEQRAFNDDESVPLHPGLTEDERTYCLQSLESLPDSARIKSGQGRWMTPDGAKPCARYPDEKAGTGNFVMLTSEFFETTYGGVNNAVLMMSACSVGVESDLMDALDGENTAVIGWTAGVSIAAAAEAGKLIAATLVEVDESIEGDSGLTVGQVMTKVRNVLDEAQQNAPSEAECAAPDLDPEVLARCATRYGQVLGVINDRPADALTGAMLRIVGDDDVRAREVVYLIDRSGDELRDGGTLVVTREEGSAGARSLNLRIRVDGLELEDDPRGVSLEVAVDGRTRPVSEPLDRQLTPGVWELDHRLPLGDHHRPGAVVDLEVRGVLPNGRESRWIYRDIRLLETWWEVEVTGGPVAFPILTGRRVGHQMHVVLGMADPAGAELDLSPLPPLTIALQAGRGFVEGSNTGLVTVHFRELGYTCSGFSGGGFQLTLASVKPLDGAFEGRVTCTPGRLDDPSRFKENLSRRFEAHATGRFRAR